MDNIKMHKIYHSGPFLIVKYSYCKAASFQIYFLRIKIKMR